MKKYMSVVVRGLFMIPEIEYQECLNKAQAVISALNTANGGID